MASKRLTAIEIASSLKSDRSEIEYIPVEILDIKEFCQKVETFDENNDKKCKDETKYSFCIRYTPKNPLKGCSVDYSSSTSMKLWRNYPIDGISTKMMKKFLRKYQKSIIDLSDKSTVKHFSGKYITQMQY